MGGTTATTIRGTTAECIVHFGKREFNSSERAELEKALDSKWITVRRWMLGNFMPNGTRLIKLRVLLLRKGYSVTDVNEFDGITLALWNMFADGDVSLEDIKKTLGYKSENEVLRFLLTPGYLRRLSAQRQAKVRELGRVNSEVEQEAQADLSKDLFLTAASNIVKALLPFAEMVAGDSFSPADRKRLRELSGSETIFRLSNAIVALTGERARDNSKTPSVKRS